MTSINLASHSDFGGNPLWGRLGKMTAKGLTWWVLAAAILGGAGILRLAVLDADPPATLSPDFVSDETWWAHNARNHALFGQWRLDDFNQGFFAAPLHTLLERLSFAAGGIHLRQARIVSALAGLVTIASIGGFMKRSVGPRGAVVAMAILATDYFTVSYDRSAFVEPLPTAFMSLSLLMLTWPGLGRAGLGLAGVAADLACLSKINSVFFLATPVLWVWLRPRAAGPRARRGDVVALLVGMAVPLLVFGATFVLPNLPEYLSQNGRLREESRVRGLLGFLNIFTITIQGSRAGLTFSGVLTQALLPTTLGLLWFLHAKSQAARYGFRALLRGLSDAELAALLWIAAFFPYFVLQDNTQDRRYYMFVVPLTMLGAHLFAGRRGERLELHTSDLRARRALIVLAACFLVAGVYLRIPLVAALDDLLRNVPIGNQPGLSTITLSFMATGLLALVTLPALWVLLRRLPRASLNAMTVALVIALAGGAVQSVRFVNAASSLTYTVDRASHAFRAAIGPGARVVDGQPLILESDSRNLILLDRRGFGYPFYGMTCLDEYQPTHLMFSARAPVDQAKFESHLRDMFGDRYQSVPASLTVFESCPDERGRMRFFFALGRITPMPSRLSSRR